MKRIFDKWCLRFCFICVGVYLVCGSWRGRFMRFCFVGYGCDFERCGVFWGWVVCSLRWGVFFLFFWFVVGWRGVKEGGRDCCGLFCVDWDEWCEIDSDE